MPVNPHGTTKAERLAREQWFEDETRRVERQRTLWAMLPDTRAVDNLKTAMLAQAWTLLEIGECEAADALLEFLPSRDADRLLDSFFGDDFYA